MSEVEAEELRRILYRIAGEASGLLRDMACSGEATRRVKGETFRADLASEEYIVDALRSEGLKAKIVSEESGVIDMGDDYVVLVDPLDGSRNYVNCIPWSSVSIAILPGGAKSLAETLAGVVAPVFYGDPLSFSTSSCYQGSARIPPPEGSERFLYVYVEHPEAAVRLAEIIDILGRGFKVRSLGSAALEVAYVAIGRGTAFIDLRPKLRNIDIAAAAGLASRCGATLAGPGGTLDSIGVGRVERIGPIAVFSKSVSGSVIDDIVRGPLSSAGHSSLP